MSHPLLSTPRSLTRARRSRPSTLALAATLLIAPLAGSSTLFAQAGGGAGGGAGTGSGAGGAGAGAAGAGSAGAPGGGAGQAGSATTGTTGAATQGTPGNAATTGVTNGQQQSATSPVTGAAAPGADPRKPPAARPGALTLEQVVQRARANNPALLAAEANLRAVRAQEVQAGVRANPYLGLAGTNISNPASSNNPYSYSVQVSRLFERGNKREYRLENARATTQQTAAQLEDTSRQTILSVRSAFTHMLISKAALELSRSQLVDFRHEVDINHDRLLAGDISRLDFERLDLQLADFESDEANNEVNLRQASDQLQTLLGVDSPSPDFDITGDIVPPLVLQTREDLIRTALNRRPDLQAANFGITAAQAASRLAIANGTADPTLEGEYDRSGTENSAGFNLNIPIRLFDRNQGNKATARIEIENAQFTTTAARNQVVSDVDQAWVGYSRTKGLSDRFSQHFLDESSDVLSIARFSYDHGGLALIDYLDALRDSRSATSDALNAYQNTWLAIHQLSAATATDLTP